MSEKREEVHFESGDGRCAAWLLRPHPVDSTSVALVVMAHGFTATREDGLLPFAERFAEQGIATLAFDYRGFGDSQGGERQVLNIGRELDDLDAALDFALRLEGIDPRRIALWGSSFGGGMVLETAAKRHSVACAIAQVPFVDGLASLRCVPARTAARLGLEAMRDIRAHRSGRPRVMVPAAGEPGSIAMMTSPDALPGFDSITPPGSRHVNSVAAGIALAAIPWRPGARAASIACPLLVQVASDDAITPARAAAKAASAAPLGELRRYGCGHFDVYSGKWFERVVEDQVSFLSDNLMKAAGREPTVVEVS